MTIREGIYERRSVRSYRAEEISDQDLLEILEAGAHAPSAMNSQPWYFVAVKSQGERKRLLAVMKEVSQKIHPSLQESFKQYPEVVEETTQFIQNLGGAPVCVLAFLQRPKEEDYEPLLQSVAAGLENMALLATEKEISSCWLTAPYEVGAGEELRKLFAPEKGDLVAIMTLGYSDQVPKMPRRKTGRYKIV